MRCFWLILAVASLGGGGCTVKIDASKLEQRIDSKLDKIRSEVATMATVKEVQALAKAIAGADTAAEGTVTIGGKVFTFASKPRDAAAKPPEKKDPTPPIVIQFPAKIEVEHKLPPEILTGILKIFEVFKIQPQSKAKAIPGAGMKYVRHLRLPAPQLKPRLRDDLAETIGELTRLQNADTMAPVNLQLRCLAWAPYLNDQFVGHLTASSLWQQYVRDRTYIARARQELEKQRGRLINYLALLEAETDPTRLYERPLRWTQQVIPLLPPQELRQLKWLKVDAAGLVLWEHAYDLEVV